MSSNISFVLHEEDAKRVQLMDSRAKRRQKRAWVLPGTLWCGRGSNANDYEQLGMFEYADKCCREHDHCEHIIRSFSVNFGVFNPSLFTLSHCDCDHRFKQCLLNGNDTVSNMVGYSFFNVLKIRCFEFIQKRQCTQYNWFGVCTRDKLAPVALLKESTPYNTTNLTTNNSHAIDLSCNDVPIKQKTSKPKRIRPQTTCAPVDFAKQKTLRKLVSQFEKRKKLQTTANGKGSKPVKANSLMTFTGAPQRKTSKKRKMIAQKLKMETLLQNTQSITRLPSTSAKTLLKTTAVESKQRSGKRTRQNKRKRLKNKTQKSRKTRKEKQIQTQKR